METIEMITGVIHSGPTSIHNWGWTIIIFSFIMLCLATYFWISESKARKYLQKQLNKEFSRKFGKTRSRASKNKKRVSERRDLI